MWTADRWKDYELIDTSDGERLERWGSYTLIRPDPQIVWHGRRASDAWRHADGTYHRSSSGGGSWNNGRRLKSEWNIGYDLGIGEHLTFIVRPTGFKHTGLFPEQAANWEWFTELIKTRVASGRPVRVLNLFAYTGGATVAAAAAGASVCHVDAAKGMVAQAKENARLSGLGEAPIRYIVDDCKKFVERELRRGKAYDAVIMDPPSYGRGPSGEIWKLEDSIDDLIVLASRALSDDPLFFLVNSYTTGLSPSVVSYIMGTVPAFDGGELEACELGLPVTETGMSIPCGSSARWSAKH